MSIYVIRHGQTALNTECKFNGAVDEDLSEVGIAQAKKAGKQLKGKNFAAVFCSPYKRTVQTLQNLSLNPDTAVYFDERLIERQEGKLTGVKIEKDFLNNVYLNINAEPGIEGLETIEQVFARVFSLLDDVKVNFQNEDVLLVTHGMIGRAIYYYFNKLPENGLLGDHAEAFLNNCEIRKFDFGKDSFESLPLALE